ncbi:MAG: DUF5615 family PIN-like protein [Longimicrobiaceae bacterium]
MLLDENLPRLLQRDLPGFDVQTVAAAGWAGVQNGELLRRAEAEFDVFITADRGLPYQRNLSQLSMGVVVLMVRSPKLEDLQPHASVLRQAIIDVQPGHVLYVPPVL